VAKGFGEGILGNFIIDCHSGVIILALVCCVAKGLKGVFF